MSRGRLAIEAMSLWAALTFWDQNNPDEAHRFTVQNALIGYPGGGWALEDWCVTTEYVRLIGKLLYCDGEK